MTLYLDHVGSQLFGLFLPESIVKELHQSVNLLPVSSILISMLRQFFLAFDEAWHPEEVLLRDNHHSFGFHGLLQRPRRPSLGFSWPIKFELAERQACVDGWCDINIDRELDVVIWMLIFQRQRRSVCRETGREFSCQNKDSNALLSGHGNARHFWSPGGVRCWPQRAA